MTFTAPWGLLALLALPAIVILHRFRNRLPERRVAALFLFPSRALIAGAGRTRTRLLHTPSLWLELLAATLLSLWLAGLSFGGRGTSHLVLVLDDSASMSVAATRQRALAAIGERLSALAAGDFVTVLRSGPRPQVLVGPRARAADGRAVLGNWRPSLPRHDLAPSLDLARELAHGGGEAVLVTDEPPPPGHEDIAVLAFGSAPPNTAILSALRLPGDAGERLRVRIGGTGAVATTNLALFDGDRSLLRQPIVFAQGVADVELPLPAGVDVLRLELDADALPIDDRAWLLPPLPRVVALACELSPAQRTGLAFDRLLAALPQVREERSSAAAQVLVRGTPGTPVDGQIELVVARGDGEGVAWRGPFAIDRGSPFLAGVTLQGVVWVGTREALPGQVLVAAGSQPLLSEEPLDQGRRLWLRLDAEAGNLSKAPDWPVLWANLVELARSAVPGPETPQVELGGEARFRRSGLVGAPDAVVQLQAPDGSRLVGGDQRTLGFVPSQAGVHTFVGVDGRPLGRCAVRFVDPSESDLRTTRSEQRAAVPRDDAGAIVVARDTAWERRVLAVLVLLCVLGDWWVLQRRAV